MTDNKYPTALPAGTVLAGMYEITHVLGQGGFGITYAAKDMKNDRKVAIKEFFPEAGSLRTGSSNSVTPITGDKQENFNYGLECFINEAKLIAHLDDVPNIAHVYNCFHENGTAYFSMEYIDGLSFKDYLKQQNGRIPWQQAAAILLPVMDALSAVHATGIIHRDVTPDNIYLTFNGNVKLLDFGSARFSLGDKTKTLDVVLKHGYAPKEQYMRRGRQGPYTDVYSLAACFYAAVTGRVPPDAPERMEEDEILEPSTLGARIPLELEDAIMKGLEVRAEDRFQAMDEFKKAVLDGCGDAAANLSVPIPQKDAPVNTAPKANDPAVPPTMPLNNGYTGVPPTMPLNNGYYGVPPTMPLNNGYQGVPPTMPSNNGYQWASREAAAAQAYNAYKPQQQKKASFKKPSPLLIAAIILFVLAAIVGLNEWSSYKNPDGDSYTFECGDRTYNAPTERVALAMLLYDCAKDVNFPSGDTDPLFTVYRNSLMTPEIYRKLKDADPEIVIDSKQENNSYRVKYVSVNGYVYPEGAAIMPYQVMIVSLCGAAVILILVYVLQRKKTSKTNPGKATGSTAQ